MLIPNLKQLLAKALQNWQKDNAPRLAAAFAFYAMLALSPMLVLFVAIACRLIGVSQPGLPRVARDRFVGRMDRGAYAVLSGLGAGELRRLRHLSDLCLCGFLPRSSKRHGRLDRCLDRRFCRRRRHRSEQIPPQSLLLLLDD